MRPITSTHPVETIDRDFARAFLALQDLELPTEAQWERAARAGEALAFGASANAEGLPERTNCADETFHEYTGLPVYFVGRTDSWVLHAPVDAVERSPWGFFGMYGNVSEWARDGSSTDEEPEPDPEVLVRILPGTGERIPAFINRQVHRGGCYSFSDQLLGVAMRGTIETGARREIIGVRPCRPLDE
jgi:formylglycine-generating enzyme required for sulfatase activity